MPLVRQVAKTIGEPQVFLDAFLTWTEPWYEEVLVAFITVGKLKDNGETLRYLEKLLPYNDGWATNDLLCPSLRQMAKHPQSYWPYLSGKSGSPNPWDVRFSLICMMDWYLNDTYIREVLEVVQTVGKQAQYVMLAASWLLATAMIDYPKLVLPLLEPGKLDVLTQKKTIQKARESYRIPDGLKETLGIMRQAL